MKIIARIRSDFPTKFGIPRQSGRVEELTACIVFEPEYRVREAVKGLEDFSHIWLLWEFSQSIRENWSPTVRPPRLGGNERMGVFATRSPFRPNPVGLSCVKLEKIDLESKEAPVLIVSGADLMDGTPIYDIKPYLPAADCHPEALGGFATKVEQHFLQERSRKNGRQGFRRISLLRWKACSERIRGLPTRKIRRGYTECLLQEWMFIFR